MEYLGMAYGTEYRSVVDIARTDPKLSEPLNADGETLAEVVYAVRSEMARTLTDIIMRRTGIGTLGNPGEGVLKKVADVAAAELGWDSEKTADEIKKASALLALPR